MPLPGDVNVIILTGTYLDMQGNPRAGTVAFTPSAPLLVDSGSSTILGGIPVVVSLNTSGAFSVTLPCTSGLTPSGWLWQVTENLSEAQQRVYSIALPHTLGSTVDISALTPSGTVGTPSLYLLASQASEFDAAGLAATAAADSLPLPSGGTFPGGTTEFLRADQTWAVPPGGGGGGGGAVSSVFGRTGAVTATSGDYTVSEVTGAAALAGPTFTGTPKAPTATALTNSVQIATTAYADAAVAVETSARTTAEALKAPLASPALTGTPTAPTVTPASDSSTKVATTAFVQSAIPAVPAYETSATPAFSSSVVLNLAAGLTQSITLTGNCALSFTGWPSGSTTASGVTVIVIENGTGGWIPTFSGVTWIGDVPGQNTAPGGISVYCFLSPNGGTTVYGAGVSNAFTGPATGDIFDWYNYSGSLVVSIDSTGRAHFNSGVTTGSMALDGTAIFGSDGNPVINIVDAPSAVNFVDVVSATTTNGVSVNAAGSDANIDLFLNPAGTGAIGLNGPVTGTAPAAGSAAALPATPAGYLSIKVGGTVRQIAYY